MLPLESVPNFSEGRDAATREFDRLMAWRGRPKTTVNDNGTELTR